MCRPPSARCGPTDTQPAAVRPRKRPWCCCRDATRPPRCGGSTSRTLRKHRSVIGVDLLGEAGLSVQDEPITGPDDEAQWLDEALAGLGLDRVHLMGVSIGGWTAVNYASRRPGRAASLVLLDPVFTFAPITVKAVLVSPVLFLPGVPQALRRSSAQLDLRRCRRRRLAARGRPDLRGFDRLRAAQGDAQADHRRAVALAGHSRVGIDRRPQRDARR